MIWERVALAVIAVIVVVGVWLNGGWEGIIVMAALCFAAWFIGSLVTQ